MYTVRNIVEQDIDTLADMEVEISIISFKEEAITDKKFHEKRIVKAFEKDSSGMFVIEEDSNIYGWLWMDKKENYLTGEIYINFRSFFVVERIRGSIYTDQLMKKGIEYCESINAKRIVGKVSSENLPMRAVYKNAGFKATHITMEMEL